MNEILSRRAFLRVLTVLGASALLPPPADAQTAPPRFVPVGKATSFPPGATKLVTLPGGQAVFVRRVSAKSAAPTFHALSARCTHKGCVVAWSAGTRQFHCPCHGGKFDAQGRPIAGPPPSPLPSLPVKVVRSLVLVAV